MRCFQGGAIYSLGGTVTITGCDFTGNSAVCFGSGSSATLRFRFPSAMARPVGQLARLRTRGAEMPDAASSNYI